MNMFDQVYEYQAGGKTVSLRPDKQYMGVNLGQLDAAQVATLKILGPGHMQKINDRVAIIAKESFPKAMIDHLLRQNAIFPVFNEGRARVIALPEVRVEPPAGKAGMAGFKNLGKWLGQHEDQVQVVAEKPDRVVLAPLSGYGPDAVTLARDITRKFKSLTASPRFLRVVPRPRIA